MSDKITLSQNQIFMHRALELAKLGRFSTKPNPCVGCVLVKNGKIIGEGWHKKAGEPHAEINAINNALKNRLSAKPLFEDFSNLENPQDLKTQNDAKNNLSVIGNFENPNNFENPQAYEILKDATAYVTLEPCSHTGRTPPCALALIKVGIKKVVIGMKDPNPKVAGNGIKLLQAAGIEVEVGILSDEIFQLNKAFNHKMQTAKAWITSKIAMSLDAKTALKNGESKWITTKASRLKVQELRALSACVLTGIETILADDSNLSVRKNELAEFLQESQNISHNLLENPTENPKHNLLENLQIEQPWRAVLDTNFRILPSAQVIGDDAKCIIFVGEKYAQENPQEFQAKKTQLALKDCKVFTVPIGYNNRLNLMSVFEKLTSLECNNILIEAGANLNGACVYEDLIDEFFIFQAPTILGDKARSAFKMPELTNLSNKKTFKIANLEKFDADICINLVRISQ